MFDQALAPTGLRSTQLVILIAAYVLECGAAQFARELIMDRSTLARNLRPLAQQGLLRLATARGRSRVVELTPRGKLALVKAIPYWEKAQGARSAIGGSTAENVRGSFGSCTSNAIKSSNSLAWRSLDGTPTAAYIERFSGQVRNRPSDPSLSLERKAERLYVGGEF